MDTKTSGRFEGEDSREVVTESYYVIPFFESEGDAVPKIWDDQTLFVRKKYNIRYLATFTGEIISERDDALCKWTVLTEEGRSYFGFPASDASVCMSVNKSDNKRKGQEDYPFALGPIEMIRFAGGCCFLAFNIKTKGYTLERFSEFNHAFCKFMAAGEKLTYKSGDTEFSMIGNVKQMLDLDSTGSGVELFPSFKTMRCNVFHRVLGDAYPVSETVEGVEAGDHISEEKSRVTPEKERLEDRKTKELTQLYHLTRGLSGDGNTSREQVNKSLYSSISGTTWSVSPGGASILIMAEQGDSFLRGSLCSNLMRDYFYAFILALFERETLLYYNKEVVKNCNDLKKLSNMKDSLIKFDLCFSYNTISEEENYQEFYLHLYEAMDLGKLEVDVEDVINKVAEYTTSAKEQRVNTLLTAIGILAVFSALVDSFNFVDWWVERGYPFQAAYVLVGFIILGVVFFGVRAYFKGK